MSRPVFHFGDFRLDPSRFELLRNGLPVRIERKPLELLILLASSEGRLVSREEIASSLWDKEVFVDTEHGINTAVRKIRAALRDDPEDPRFLQTVTGMGYRFIAPLQITQLSSAEPQPKPQPAEPPTEAVAPAPAAAPPHRRSRLALLVSAAVLAAIIVCLAILLAVRLAHGRSQTPIRSLAVLPLANFSGDPNQDYFADGMTDELITMLVRDSTLRIPSRTTVLHYKDTPRPLPEIARDLHVDAIVEGSISRSGQQVHLNLQLIRADTDTHLWAESYDRDLNEVAALPDEAARAIAARLNSPSSQHPPPRYVRPEAHDAYLRGHYLWSVGRNAEAGRYYEQAIALQPDYALGWTGLSQYLVVEALLGHLNAPTALHRAQDASRRAIQLDDTLPQAHSNYAATLFFGDWDGPHALQEVNRAIELDPRYAEGIHLRALILCAMGRYDEALATQRQGTAIDPMTHPGAMAEILLYGRHYQQSIDDAQMRLTDFPEAHDLLFTLASADHFAGRDRSSAEMLARLYGAAGTPNSAILNAFASGGYPAVLRWWIANVPNLSGPPANSPAALATLYAELGDRDRALQLLDQALRQHDPNLVFLGADCAYDSLRADPRFAALVKRVGLAPSS